MKKEITNARRFIQIASIVLFFCLISDFPQPCDVNKAANCALIKVNFLGIQFSIERWMVIMGVPLISAYAPWMYGFFGFWKNKTPNDTRKDLEEFTIKPKQLPVGLLKGKEKMTVGDFRLYEVSDL